MEGAEHPRTPFGAFLRSVGDDGGSHPRADAAAAVADRSVWRQLFEPVTPIDWESLRGLTMRSCHANFLPNSFGLLQHLGLVHRNRVNVSEDPGIDPAELAHAMRVAEDEVRARRYEPLARGHVSFFGLDINRRRIETAIRRFSPLAFRKDDPHQPHHHRAAWELRDIPFCLEAWDMLQDTCHCEPGGVVQRWSRTKTRVEECDECGDPLAWLEPFEVPLDMRSALHVLRAIVLPSPEARLEAVDLLPEPLRATDRSALFAMVVRLANAVDPSAADVSIENPRARLGALHSACDALRQWPRGLIDIELAPGTPGGTRDWLRSLWNKLGRGEPVGAAKAKQRRTPKPATARRNAADGPVGIRRATEIAKLSPEVLHAAWEHRMVTRHERMHGERVVPAFDQGELIALGAEWRRRRQPDSLAFEYGLPLYAIEQFASVGCVLADVRSIPGTGPHFTPESVGTFENGMIAGVSSVSEPIALRQAMRLVGGRLKPWGPAFRRLIDGGIPYDLVEGRRLVDRIVVEREHVEAIASLLFDDTEPPRFGFSDTMVQGDALEVLNAGGDLAHLLDAIPSTGRNPKSYRVSDVLDRARQIVTLPEIAAVLETDPASALQELTRKKLVGSRLLPGGWPRDLLKRLR